jgi:hypothetical protein|eukprot:COSAG06_NODE_3149_length_5769_cov_76.274427_3_plen_270_part_00
MQWWRRGIQQPAARRPSESDDWRAIVSMLRLATAVVVAVLDRQTVAAQEERSCQRSPYYLAGEPVASLVPPGQCVFGEDWAPAPLLSRQAVSHDTILLTFGLADSTKPLGLSTCACLLIQGGNAVRPYTPVSTNHLLGQFELMVKVYDEKQGGGTLSRHLDGLEIGETVNVKHIPFNVKVQSPVHTLSVSARNRARLSCGVACLPAWLQTSVHRVKNSAVVLRASAGKKKVAMLVGGTGITPMLQVTDTIAAFFARKTVGESLIYRDRL